MNRSARKLVVLSTSLAITMLFGLVALKLRAGPAREAVRGPAPLADAGRAPRGAAAAPAQPSFIGVLLPEQMANVSSRSDGRLVRIPAKVGAAVRKGDVLVAFDSRERKQELAMAEAHLKAARGAAAAAGADFAAARSRAQRRSAVVDVNGKRIPLVSGEEASQSAFEASGAAGRAANAAGQVGEQKARIEALKIALEEAELRAPFDGLVTGVYFDVGMNVHGGETLVRLASGNGTLRVRIALPEEEYARVRQTTTARLALDDGRTLDALVSRISPEVDAATRTIFVEGDVWLADAERNTAVLAGRTVRATLAAIEGR